MQEQIVIKKEELDIDDTKIKLELDEDAPQLELPCATRFIKIIDEKPNMITVPVHDYKSEDELKFIESLRTVDQQQKLFVTSSCENDGALACNICSYRCENRLALASHQINHQLNRHFCYYGCEVWCDMLEEILEHEFRQHASSYTGSSCRICLLECSDAASLAKHLGSHFFVRRFVCAICRRHFETNTGLQLHWQHSKGLCGQVEYADMHGNVGQLVAVNRLDMNFDVQIKTEPLDAAEEQTEQDIDMSDVIKTEPQIKEEIEEESKSDREPSWASDNSLAGQLRGKLRLPAIKKPVNVETAKQNKSTAIQLVPSDQLKPVQLSISEPKQLNNILNASKGPINPPKVVQPVKNKPHIASNILKVLPSNCMLFKLPPNTKIVKISPSSGNINTNNCSTGSTVVTPPSALSISSVSQPSNSPTVAKAPSAVASQVAGTQKPTLNRNAYFNALSLFESLPESRKIITEFQNQIRSIEQTLPMPGSVLQMPKKSNKLVVQTQLEVLKMPLTKASHSKVRQLRFTYPNHRFHWECPKCARCYELYLAFCNHLTTQVHGIAEAEFEQMEVEVKMYKRSNESKTPVTDAAGAEEKVAASVVAYSSAPEASAPVDVPAPPSAVAPVNDAAAVTTAVSCLKPASENSSSPPNSAKSARPGPIVRPAQYQCDDCAKCFTTVGALRIHKMIHTGELPHKCNFCEKRFRTPGQVRVHQRRHTGEKPFKCKVCSLDFTHRETLISHLSRHIGMKRYKCYGCDKNFVVVSGLRAHRRLRPDTCGKVKFTARAHGPRVRVIRGEVVFESHPEHNGYLRSEDPINIMSEIKQASVTNETKSS
ncbi:uncharacterized protein Dmoj_GI18195 [Drosophila mojavensis]|uniref:C2H2-type domain-containing protein n=1 Tax=Drosophila mojavensis TaxID=7230 RepID=B4KIB1_DROMO|nr:uncharacterized protein Dmoj_GI18195 [Drosophila mojavensis]